MLTKRAFVIAASLSALALSAPALAFQAKPFDAKGFEAAQNAGKSILIEVHAPWCPTCKAQEPILSSLSKKSDFKDLAVFKVDFDSQKDALKLFNARQQSTLIVFKGKQEKGRSVGDTNAASIEKLLAGSL